MTFSGTTPHLHEQVPTALTEFYYGPPGKISSGQILPSDPLREAFPPGYATRNITFFLEIERKIFGPREFLLP